MASCRPCWDLASGEGVDVLIVGSGPIGSAFARTLVEQRPGTRVLLVDAGPQLTPVPGVHVKNIADEDERLRAQIRSQGPGFEEALAEVTARVRASRWNRRASSPGQLIRSEVHDSTLFDQAGGDRRACLRASGRRWSRWTACAALGLRGERGLDALEPLDDLSEISGRWGLGPSRCCSMRERATKAPVIDAVITVMKPIPSNITAAAKIWPSCVVGTSSP